MATLPSSAYLRICLTSSLRRSSVSWGKARRMHLPSFWGLMPRSDSWMAFSMRLQGRSVPGLDDQRAGDREKPWPRSAEWAWGVP